MSTTPCPVRLSRRGYRNHGFTLVEMMITVAIIGILAAIAYPSYANHIRKAKRATAQAALMDLASKEQTYLLDRRDYTNSIANLGFAVPTEIASDYTFTFPAGCARCYSAGATPPMYIVQATPSAALAAKGEQTLTIDDTGAKTPAGVSGYWGK